MLVKLRKKKDTSTGWWFYDEALKNAQKYGYDNISPLEQFILRVAAQAIEDDLDWDKKST